MRFLATVKTLLAALFLFSSITSHADNDNFRSIIHKDKTRTEFHRFHKEQTLIKRTYTAAGALQILTIYKTGPDGDFLNYEIFDANRRKLCYSTRAYDKKTGLLVEENMWNRLIKHIDKETRQETPIRRFFYTYDAQGRIQRPIPVIQINNVF